MKKLLILIVALVAAMNVNAQWYVGGSVGFGSAKNGGGDSETTYKILPEIGYNLNDQWAIGVGFGYRKGTCDFGYYNFSMGTTEYYAVCPYARYTFWKSGIVNTFIDGGVGFESVKDTGSYFYAGLTPGIAVKASDHISFVTRVGFIGFESFSPKGDGESSNAFGVNLDGYDILFGVYYTF